MDEQVLSNYKKNSEIMLFNQSHITSPYPVSEAIADIVTKSLRIGYETNGAMDITVGPLTNLWGFGINKKPEKIPNKIQIEKAKKKVGLHHLMVINQAGKQYLKKDIPDLFLDLSTIGEGYAADHLSILMTQEKISRYLVSVGGALVGRGTNASGNSWKIAIQKPTEQENTVQNIVTINGYGISTAGSYRNYYKLEEKRISHIIDPQTGFPITHNLISVTVIAPTAMEADAWDTGIMVLGLDKAKEVILRKRLAVYMITQQLDGIKTWMSPQFSSFLLDKKRE